MSWLGIVWALRYISVRLRQTGDESCHIVGRDLTEHHIRVCEHSILVSPQWGYSKIKGCPRTVLVVSVR
jgi:hypothetical protein